MRRKVIADIDGGNTALALCGHAPYGDCQSVRYRLDAARGQVIKLTAIADELERHLPDDEYVAIWRHEIKVWRYAITRGESLLARLERKP